MGRGYFGGLGQFWGIFFGPTLGKSKIVLWRTQPQHLMILSAILYIYTYCKFSKSVIYLTYLRKQKQTLLPFNLLYSPPFQVIKYGVIFRVLFIITGVSRCTLLLLTTATTAPLRLPPGPLPTGCTPEPRPLPHLVARLSSHIRV